MGGGNLSEQEIRSDSILGDNLIFFFYYSSTIRVDIGIWSYSAVSHTDTVVRMKKNSVIKLLFVYHKGIPLMMMADVINVFMRRLG